MWASLRTKLRHSEQVQVLSVSYQFLTYILIGEDWVFSLELIAEVFLVVILTHLTTSVIQSKFNILNQLCVDLANF